MYDPKQPPRTLEEMIEALEADLEEMDAETQKEEEENEV